jgi:multidrug efflux pump subunit AcrB
MLTALAVVAGATVILTDPTFQGLAIALMAGSLISMFTAPVLAPLLYFMANNRKERVALVSFRE